MHSINRYFVFGVKLQDKTTKSFLCCAWTSIFLKNWVNVGWPSLIKTLLCERFCTQDLFWNRDKGDLKNGLFSFQIPFTIHLSWLNCGQIVIMHACKTKTKCPKQSIGRWRKIGAGLAFLFSIIYLIVVSVQSATNFWSQTSYEISWELVHFMQCWFEMKLHEHNSANPIILFSNYGVKSTVKGNSLVFRTFQRMSGIDRNGFKRTRVLNRSFTEPCWS